MNTKLYHNNEQLKHWWKQRITSLILALIVFIWLFSFSHNVRSLDESEIIDEIKKPYNIIMIVVFTLLSLYHSALGLKDVIEDYIGINKVTKYLIYCLNAFILVTSIAFILSVIHLMMIN